MLIKKQTDDSPLEKDHTKGKDVRVNAMQDVAATLGTYSHETLCSLPKMKQVLSK